MCVFCSRQFYRVHLCMYHHIEGTEQAVSKKPTCYPFVAIATSLPHLHAKTTTFWLLWLMLLENGYATICWSPYFHFFFFWNFWIIVILFNFLSYGFSQQLQLFYIPTRLLVTSYFCQYLIFSVFDNSLHNGCEVISLWFSFAFPLWLVMVNGFSCPSWLYIFFGEICV